MPRVLFYQCPEHGPVHEVRGLVSQRVDLEMTGNNRWCYSWNSVAPDDLANVTCSKCGKPVDLINADCVHQSTHSFLRSYASEDDSGLVVLVFCDICGTCERKKYMRSELVSQYILENGEDALGD